MIEFDCCHLQHLTPIYNPGLQVTTPMRSEEKPRQITDGHLPYNSELYPSIPGHMFHLIKMHLKKRLQNGGRSLLECISVPGLVLKIPMI